jgi:ABC-2 type transport system ATP-binding protein
MMKRPPFDPKKASRLVEMQGVSSMECYRHPDGALRRVLKDVSLTVARGEAWGVTSDEPFELALLMEIMGNVKPYEAGRCSLCEMGMMRLKRRVLDHLYYVNDQKLMYPHMRVLSWLMFASRHAGSAPAAQQVEWLELLLELDLYHVTITYGRFLTAAEQAAVALLLSLKMDRVQLVMADLSHITVPEPLYPAFSGIIQRLKERGKSVVLASPQRDLIQCCSDHAAFLLDGALERQGTVEELCARYDNRRLLVATDATEAAEVLERACPGMRAESHPGEVWLRGVYRVSLAEAAAALEKAGVPFQSVEAAQPSLELAFREVPR